MTARHERLVSDVGDAVANGDDGQVDAAKERLFSDAADEIGNSHILRAASAAGQGDDVTVGLDN